MLSRLRRWFRPAPVQMSAAWLKERDRFAARIEYQGPAWNWRWLQRRAKLQLVRERRGKVA